MGDGLERRALRAGVRADAPDVLLAAFRLADLAAAFRVAFFAAFLAVFFSIFFALFPLLRAGARLIAFFVLAAPLAGFRLAVVRFVFFATLERVAIFVYPC
ncbi:MAG: hypothetical protein RIC93_09320 [Alphaproteobacteria bacterium]